MSTTTESETEVERDVTLTIDGQEVQAAAGETILEAADRAGIDIPTLCAHANLTNVGACRMCLVDVDGERRETACTTAVDDGMDVEFDTEDLWEKRRSILELQFTEENHYCMYCEMEGDCELEDMFNRAGLDQDRFPLEYKDIGPDTSNEYITMDLDRCISCGRCIRTCEEVVANDTLNFGNRGRETTIIADSGVPLGESSCTSCGGCVQACPTGTLYSPLSAYKGRERDCEVETTTCSECSVGCELEVFTNSGRIVKIEGIEAGEDGGQLCEMGRFELLDDRRERIKAPRTDGETVGLDAALETVADKLVDANSVNAVASDRLPTETLEVFADAMDAVDADLEIPGAKRRATEAAIREELAGDGHGDLQADSIEDVLDAEGIVVYDTSIVDTHPVAASYVRRAAKDGAELVTVDGEEDRLKRFSDDSLTVGSPLAQATAEAAGAVADGGSASPVAGVAEAATRALDAENGVVVLGPEIEDTGALVDAYGLAAMTDSRILSLDRGANRADLAADVIDEPAEVAYLLAGDDRGEDLDRSIEVARQADIVIAQATRESALTEIADVVLPALDWFEREGTTVDADGDERRIDRVLDPRSEIDSDREIIAELKEVAA
ncbi:2Fe-2S iron-sulfur cluster-binding protein [Halorhabdus amylolytica]|uniref:2Fe-2S iron-sulfur cluster-binding protein n=1 Tax=Halorhabdus amylolytica TaxID=2559573 RepID=UPI0010AAE87A|nr:2Fe-2S iron-sulfur cluster-binding protein [Halorhabdus amylolytica]